MSYITDAIGNQAQSFSINCPIDQVLADDVCAGRMAVWDAVATAVGGNYASATLKQKMQISARRTGRGGFNVKLVNGFNSAGNNSQTDVVAAVFFDPVALLWFHFNDKNLHPGSLAPCATFQFGRGHSWCSYEPASEQRLLNEIIFQDPAGYTSIVPPNFDVTDEYVEAVDNGEISRVITKVIIKPGSETTKVNVPATIAIGALGIGLGSMLNK